MKDSLNIYYNLLVYKNSPINNPKGPSGGLYHVVRGGGTGDYAQTATKVRTKSYSEGGHGFRFAMDL